MAGTREWQNSAENFGQPVGNEQAIVPQWNFSGTGSMPPSMSPASELIRCGARAAPRDTSQGGFEHNGDELGLGGLECFVNCA